MINNQKPEGPVVHPRGYLDVQDIYFTIQGEGPYAGYPAIFIRLGGCNLQCPFCDTDYTSKRVLMPPPKVVEFCSQIGKGLLVVITGGEPFRQKLSPTVRMLLNAGFFVQVETNGTYYEVSFPYTRVCIVCSPKTPRLHPQMISCIDAFKYVLDADHISDKDGLPTSVLGMSGFCPARPPEGWVKHRTDIFVQPADFQDEAQNTANLEATVKSAMKHGYRFNLQVQKIIGVK